MQQIKCRFSQASVMEEVNKVEEISLQNIIRLSPTPCLICGQFLGGKTEEIGRVIGDHHQQQQIRDDEDSSSASLLQQYFLKLFQVNPVVIVVEEGGEDKPGREHFLPFCHLCKHRLKLLMEVQRKLEELTEQLRNGRVELKKAVGSSEEALEEHGIYESDTRYRRIRRHILGYEREAFLPEEDLDLNSSSTSDPLTMEEITDSNIRSSRKPCRRGAGKSYKSGRSNPFVQLTRADRILAEGKRELSFGVQKDYKNEEELLDTLSEPDNHDFNFERDDISDEVDSQSQSPNKIPVNKLPNDTTSSMVTLVTAKTHGRPANKTSQVPNSKSNCWTKGLLHSRPKLNCKLKANANNNADETGINGDSRPRRKRAKRGTHHPNILPLEIGNDDDFPKTETDSVDDKASHVGTAKKYQKKKFKCKLCGKVLLSAEAGRLHVESIHEKRTFPCEICGKPLKSRSCLIVHKLSHLGEEEKWELRESGDQILDRVPQKRLQCEECGIYVARCSLPVHHARIHGTEEEKARYRHRHFCSKCGKYVNSMKQHLEHVHNTVRNFPCLQCEQRFKTQANLRAHRKFVHERDNYRFKCTSCPKTFCRKGSLEDHINVHLNIRQFQCQFCPAAFTQDTHLKRHIRRFHEEGSNPKRKTGIRKPYKIERNTTTQSVQM